jgi:FkbM family methyltransferase
MFRGSVRRAIKLSRLLAFPAGRLGLRHGVAATVERWRALAAFEVVTVVDVGADEGQFVLLASPAFADAAVCSFEPLTEPAARLRAVFGAKARLFEAAIGPCDKEATIYVSRRVDSSSLLPIARQTEVFPGTELKEQRAVRVAPLATFFRAEATRAPALLDIDFQGFELEALKGCESLLPLFQYVYVECSFIELYRGQALVDDVILYLCQGNFRLSGVQNRIDDPDGSPVEANFLFVNAGGAVAAGTSADG